MAQHGQAIENGKMESKRLQWCCFNHIPRQGNTVSHALARKGRSIEGEHMDQVCPHRHSTITLSLFHE